MRAVEHFRGFSLSTLTFNVQLEAWRVGILQTEEVVELATLRLSLGLPLSPAEERLALMLSDEAQEAEQLLRRVAALHAPNSDLPARICTYSRLMAILDQWQDLEHPEVMAEQLINESETPAVYSNARLYDPPLGERKSRSAHFKRLWEAAESERIAIEAAQPTDDLELA